jgi:phosphoenolpyruvate-protein kinase (PTS system EI component)
MSPHPPGPTRTAGGIGPGTRSYPGSPVAPGLAVAPSWRSDRPVSLARLTVDPRQVEQAFEATATDLDQIARRATAGGKHTAGEIVTVAALIARDVTLVGAVRDAIATGIEPRQAIQEVIEQHAAALESLPDATLRERAADIRQVGRRVLDQLAHAAAGTPAKPRMRAFILVAEELGPADLLEHFGQGLAGAVAVCGGANSHAAIIARSVGIPLVTGIDATLLDLPDNTPLLVDASRSVVVVNPDQAEMTQGHTATERRRQRRTALVADRGRPHKTADQQPFTLLCNVATSSEIRMGIDAGAQGIGLLRTELAFLDADRWPDESAHRHALQPVLAAAAEWPVTVRLLDFANDKVPPFLSRAGGDVRIGLDALLDNPDALTAQLRAVIDLGRQIDLRIMVPMVTAAEEMAAVHGAVTAIAADLGTTPPRVGAMIETAAAAEAVHDLAEVAEFFSIGTNDLTGQVLDLDRREPRARPELTAHPRVLRLVSRVVTAGSLTNRPVSVCGDAAAHPAILPLLLGAGVRVVSVACACIDETRYLLRRLDTDCCADLLTDALRLRDLDEVIALVDDRIKVAVP